MEDPFKLLGKDLKKNVTKRTDKGLIRITSERWH